MSQADFEQAKQRLLQAKQEILWFVKILDDSTLILNEYELTSNEVAQLQQKYQEDLEEIRQILEQRHFLHEVKRGVIPRPKPFPNEGVTPRVVGEIPPFDDSDQEDDFDTKRGFSR